MLLLVKVSETYFLVLLIITYIICMRSYELNHCWCWIYLSLVVVMLFIKKLVEFTLSIVLRISLLTFCAKCCSCYRFCGGNWLIFLLVYTWVDAYIWLQNKSLPRNFAASTSIRRWCNQGNWILIPCFWILLCLSLLVFPLAFFSRWRDRFLIHTSGTVEGSFSYWNLSVSK